MKQTVLAEIPTNTILNEESTFFSLKFIDFLPKYLKAAHQSIIINSFY